MNDTPATALRRIDLVDAARGVALLAMFVFHFAYDLSFFGLIATDVPADPGWRLFARLIAGSFLTLVGVGLVLATRDGLNRPAFLRRLAMVAAAAGTVTLATWFAMPQNFIFFGILHQIALASVLALPFLRLAVPVVALVAGLVFAAPALIHHPVLDHPALLWLGLGRLPLNTADYVPVFPWFGCVLAGTVLARLVLRLSPGASWLRWRAQSQPSALLARAGRHSLAVYLIHQPVFLALLWLAVASGLAVPQGNEDAPFLAACERSCAVNSPDGALCRRVCACSAEALKREKLWTPALDGRLDAAQAERAAALARQCAASP